MLRKLQRVSDENNLVVAVDSAEVNEALEILGRLEKLRCKALAVSTCCDG